MLSVVLDYDPEQRARTNARWWITQQAAEPMTSILVEPKMRECNQGSEATTEFLDDRLQETSGRPVGPGFGPVRVPNRHPTESSTAPQGCAQAQTHGRYTALAPEDSRWYLRALP